MRFPFNKRKAAQAAAHLLFRHSGRLSYLLLIKLLYLADRLSLVEVGQPITGDKMVSMPHGPVLSEIYDFINWSSPEDQPIWFEYISEKEGYDVFMTMMAATASNVCSKLFKVQVRREKEIERIEREDAEKHAAQQRAMQTHHGSTPSTSDDEASQRSTVSKPPRQVSQVSVQPVRREGPKVGRNDPCPCGSGQKFKKCHGAALEEEGADADGDGDREGGRGGRRRHEAGGR